MRRSLACQAKFKRCVEARADKSGKLWYRGGGAGGRCEWDFCKGIAQSSGCMKGGCTEWVHEGSLRSSCKGSCKGSCSLQAAASSAAAEEVAAFFAAGKELAASFAAAKEAAPSLGACLERHGEPLKLQEILTLQSASQKEGGGWCWQVLCFRNKRGDGGIDFLCHLLRHASSLQYEYARTTGTNYTRTTGNPR